MQIVIRQLLVNFSTPSLWLLWFWFLKCGLPLYKEFLFQNDLLSSTNAIRKYEYDTITYPVCITIKNKCWLIHNLWYTRIFEIPISNLKYNCQSKNCYLHMTQRSACHFPKCGGRRQYWAGLWPVTVCSLCPNLPFVIFGSTLFL